MQTAKLIYILMAVLTIIPLIVFNFKRLTINKEGENPRLNIGVIVLIALAGTILSIFIFTLYRFTINYQPQLVLERFIRSYSSVASGNIEKNEFLEETKSICTPELFELLSEEDNIKENIARFQLGEIIYPKYYFDKDIFEKVEGINENDRRPIYILAMVEIGELKKYYITLLDIDGNRWFIDSFNEASQEVVDYAYRYNLMKSEHANKWFNVK